ncbi:nuclease-related domain-containing protein [Mycoplasmopsis hyopharyngis]|uniref:nuclease-related domain-containing protein n=1 Tax=Mycoplasmopsis hyopharyngis TaxID=29558 RepID=UPI0038734B15
MNYPFVTNLSLFNKIDKNAAYPKINSNVIIGIITGILVTLFIFSIVLLIIIRKNIKNKNQDKVGFLFEKKINGKMTMFAKENGYKYFNGGLFKYGSNNFFEIDGLLATNKAIFVIETKNYVGNLTGDFASLELILKNGKKDFKVKNPFLQNLKHIRHIYNMCNFNFPIFSLLVLPENTKWIIENEENWSIVVNENNYEQKIKEVINETEDIINNRTLAALAEIVESSRTASIKDIKKFGKIINNNSSKNKQNND